MLEVQKYLNSGKTIEDLKEEFAIKCKVYDSGLVALNYDQIFSPKNVPITNECRGLILIKTEDCGWIVVSKSFNRFFNLGECNNIPESWEGWKYLEKCDGCCDENTILDTDSGPKTIREICESEIFCMVRGNDIQTKMECMTPIIGHSIESMSDDWFEITTASGENIKLTANHLVWVDSKNNYVRVDELCVGDDVLIDDL